MRPETKPLLLLVDDDQTLLFSLRRLFSWDFEVRLAQNLAEARSALIENQVDAVLCDLNVGLENGEELLAELREKHPAIKRVVLSGDDHDRVDSLAKREAVHLTFYKAETSSEAMLFALRALCTGVSPPRRRPLSDTAITSRGLEAVSDLLGAFSPKKD